MRALTPFLKRFARNHMAVASLVFLVSALILSVVAPLIAPFHPAEVHTDDLSLPPFWLVGGNAAYWLGTDDVGRDLLTRLLYGGRISLGIGALSVLVSLAVGLPFGVLAGYCGGGVDALIGRGVDVLLAIPNMLLALVVVAILGPGLSNTIWAVSLVAVPGLIRIVRAAVMTEKAKPHVSAALGYGASDLRIVFKNILPNCMAPLIVQSTLGFSDAILNAAALGFLGLGVQPPLPEWGAMLADARPHIETAWWMVALPGICILAASLSFNLLGDGLRDVLDPKLK